MQKNKPNCEHGLNGLCCCNCNNQKKLMKHPMNRDFGNGSITETCGFVCAAQYEDGSNKGEVIFSELEHGMCEYWTPKK